MNGLYDELKIAAHAVWRQRWLALAIAWGVALVGWLVIALIPNAYESRARVAVDTQSLLSQAAGVSAGEQQADIDRVRTTLTANPNLERVVRGTDLVKQVASDRDMATQIANLRDAITLKALPDNVFEISARASAGGRSDPENARLAQQVVDRLVAIFAEENVAGGRAETSQTLAFLNNELARRAQQLADAEAKRVAFEQKYVGLLPGVGSIEQRMEQSRTELNQVDTDLMAAQSALGAMRGQMAGTPATVAGPAAPSGGPVGGARGRIAALENELNDAAAKGWTDQHPDVVAARAQIARLRPLAARESGGGGGGGGSVANPLYASLRTMLAERQGTVAALSSRKAQLQNDMAQFAAKQTAEPGVAAEQARLNRDYDALKASYDKLLTDRETIQLRSDVTTKTDAVQVRVIEPASAPKVPVAPKRPLLLFGVLVLALAAGIGAAFARAQLTPTFATAAKLASVTGLPVLGAVSEVVTPVQAAQRQIALRRFAMAAGGLGACFLLLMTIEFVQRGLVA